MDHIVTITINLVDLDSEQLATTLVNLAQRIRDRRVSTVDHVYDEWHDAVGTIVYS